MKSFWWETNVLAFTRRGKQRHAKYYVLKPAPFDLAYLLPRLVDGRLGTSSYEVETNCNNNNTLFFRS